MADAEHGDVLKFLAGGGQSGAQLRALDWSNTLLGDPRSWPLSLRTAVTIMLNTRYPMSIYWGQQALYLFNDAAGQSFSIEARTAAMAQPGAFARGEAWDVIGRQFQQIMAGGPATWHEKPDNLYSAYTYCVIDDPGSPSNVGGVIVIAQEAAATVLAERRRVEEAERQRSIFEQAPGIIIIMRGADHVVEFVSTVGYLLATPGWANRSARLSPILKGKVFLSCSTKSTRLVRRRRHKTIQHDTSSSGRAKRSPFTWISYTRPCLTTKVVHTVFSARVSTSRIASKRPPIYYQPKNNSV
jgi:PAS domain-containing protein